MTPRINTADWIRLQTAAVVLGVTRARVKQLVVAGILPAISIDGIDHVRRSAVEERRAADDAGKIPRKRKDT
jgi:hypothetical protein